MSDCDGVFATGVSRSNGCDAFRYYPFVGASSRGAFDHENRCDGLLKSGGVHCALFYLET
jgi:hypothetical protein